MCFADVRLIDDADGLDGSLVTGSRFVERRGPIGSTFERALMLYRLVRLPRATEQVGNASPLDGSAIGRRCTVLRLLGTLLLALGGSKLAGNVTRPQALRHDRAMPLPS